MIVVRKRGASANNEYQQQYIFYCINKYIYKYMIRGYGFFKRDKIKYL